MYRMDDIIVVPRVAEDDILALFRATGIHHPTEIQRENVLALLEGTIPDTGVFLTTGMEAAEGIQRWRGLENKMKTVDTVGEHQHRVYDMISVCHQGIFVASSSFDFKKAGFMAKNHDMSEGLSPFGDIPTPLKLQLSPRLGILLKQVEYACLEILSTMDTGDFQREDISIKDILFEMEAKKTPESQVVKYFDLVDAYMMSIHEYSLGTIEFLNRVEWYQAVFQKIHRGAYLPFIQNIQCVGIQNCLMDVPKDQYPLSGSHLLDITVLATLRIDPVTLTKGIAYQFWKKNIAKI